MKIENSRGVPCSICTSLKRSNKPSSIGFSGGVTSDLPFSCYSSIPFAEMHTAEFYICQRSVFSNRASLLPSTIEEEEETQQQMKGAEGAFSQPLSTGIGAASL